MVVQVLMRGRGGTTRARARGIGERRTGGETECIQRWGGGGKAGAGGSESQDRSVHLLMVGSELGLHVRDVLGDNLGE